MSPTGHMKVVLFFDTHFFLPYREPLVSQAMLVVLATLEKGCVMAF